MKRLLAAGASAIFQLTRSFRRGEIGRLHNPEFTILEWYHVGAIVSRRDGVRRRLRDGVLGRGARLIAAHTRVDSSGPRSAGRPFPRLTYDELFQSVLGTSVLDQSTAQLGELARACGIAPPPGLADDDHDGWLNLLLALKVEPELAKQRAAFVYDYPAGQAALARVRESKPPVAERFELYLAGIEICNGYQELTDADELRRRIAVQQGLRRREGSRPLPAESRLLAAMDFGLPECSGVALGFDRLLMMAFGRDLTVGRDRLSLRPGLTTGVIAALAVWPRD